MKTDAATVPSLDTQFFITRRHRIGFRFELGCRDNVLERVEIVDDKRAIYDDVWNPPLRALHRSAASAGAFRMPHFI